MDDLRQRFAALDRVAVPDLRPEIERRVATLAERPVAGPVRPRVEWGTSVRRQASTFGGRRFASIPVLLVLALLVLALVASLTIGAGWWERRGVLVPPSTQPPRAAVLTGDCPGAVRSDGDAPPFRGWFLGPEPGFFARPHPGRITALWHELHPDGQPPGGASPPLTQVVLVEFDPIARTTCRLLTPVRSEQGGLLDGASLPDAKWTSRGDAFAVFRGDVETNQSCCAPGELIAWWPGSHSILGFFDRDIGTLVWSNRGSWLAVSSAAAVHDWVEVGPHTVSLFPADGTQPREITFECDPCAFLAESFSPNDTRLALTFFRVHEDKTNADQLVAVADVATGTGVVLDVGPTRLRPVGWQDDRTILAVDDGRRLLAIPVDAPSQFEVVAEFPLQFGVDGIFEEWSPDRSRVAYLHWNTDQPDGGRLLSTDVFVLDVASGTTRHISREPETTGELVWAPDNRTFAYNRYEDSGGPQPRTILKIADALEGEPVSVAMGLSPIGWRPAWR